MVTFNELPSTIRVPFVGVEFDASQAQQGVVAQPYRTLLIGSRLSTGTVLQLVPTRVTSAAQVEQYAGAGSQLHAMALAYFRQNRFTETWMVGLNDAGGATAATGSFTFTGTVTGAGTLVLYVGGRRYPITVANGATLASIATAAAAAIQADPHRIASAAAVSTAVNLTARNAGELGNDIDLRANYYPGEALPLGLAVAVSAMAGGATDPDYGQVPAVLGDEHFNVWALGSSLAANLTAINTELALRWTAIEAREGVAIFGHRGTHANLITKGSGLNSKHLCMMGAKASPTPPSEWAAAVAGVVAYYGAADPSRPFQTLPLLGVLAPAIADRFNFEEQNLLLFGGVSTFTVAVDGQVQLGGLITTYRTNPGGIADDAYLFVNVPLLLGFLRYSFAARMLTRYPRHKLARDGTRFAAGAAVMTPALGRAEAIAWFETMEAAGHVEDVEQFKRDLVVEINATNPNRLDFYLPTNLINGLRVRAAQIGFRS